MELREAAEALGVHYQTAYGWVRDGLLPARKLGRGYDVSDHDVQALAARRGRGREPARAVSVRDWQAQADGLYSAITAGDEGRARRSLARLAAGVPVLDLCERVIAPALRRIGDSWAAGEVSIAQEHRASAICERLLAVHTHQAAGRPRGTAVVATAPGERHGLPALMAAACLREDHWLVHHLAADLPITESSGLARQAGARLVVLSCTMPAAAEQAEAAHANADPGGPDVLVGGPGQSLSDLIQQARHLRRPHPEAHGERGSLR